MNDVKNEKHTPVATVPEGWKGTPSPVRGAALYYGHNPHQMAYGDTYGHGIPYAAPYGGQAAYGGDSSGQESGDSILGPLSLARVMRVVLQKWPSLIVAVLLGLGVGFAYYKTAPVTYRASSVIEMQAKRPRIIKGDDVYINDPDTTGSLNEIINTRLAKLRSREAIIMVAERVRADFPTLKAMADDELYDMLIWSIEFKPRRMSRLIDISARHSRPEIAQGIVNAYAYAAEAYSVEENKASSDSGVAWLKATAEAQQRILEKANQEVLDFRVENAIDEMENRKRAVDSVLLQLNNDLARSEIEQTRFADLLTVLTEIQQDPEKIDSLPEVVPRAGEIAAAQAALRNAMTERDVLLKDFTDKHPNVILANDKVDIARRHFLDAVYRARETAVANLDLMIKQTESLRERTRVNERLSSELELKLIAAKSRLEALLRDKDVADMSYRSILSRIEEVRLALDDSSATIRIIEEAGLPRRQVSPDPRIAFSTGPLVGLVIGFLFIMVLDRLEDRVTSIADIEQHMSTKVLALIPRVLHSNRNQLVKLSAEKRFSRFAEAFAGLRGLLDSPRFADFSRVVLVVSTHPEEGKTVISSNLAMTYAMAGKKTLLVDFDLRRPRIGRMFGVVPESREEARARSLVDALDAGDTSVFDSLPIASGYENLSLVTSYPSSQISPATVMGSGALKDFFDWANSNYDNVVIDSPPYGLVSDSLALGVLSDSVILVCRPERSRYRAMRHALRFFRESGARVLGVVVNDVDFRSFGNYDYNRGYNRYGRYGRYGYGYGYYKRTHEEDAADQETDMDGNPVRPSTGTNILDVDDDDEEYDDEG